MGAIKLNGQWIGSLTAISQDDGYWVKVDNAITLSIDDADPVNYDADGEVSYNIHYTFRSKSMSIENQIINIINDKLKNPIYCQARNLTPRLTPKEEPGWTDCLLMLEISTYPLAMGRFVTAIFG